MNFQSPNNFNIARDCLEKKCKYSLKILCGSKYSRPVAITLDSGNHLLAEPCGEWTPGERVEVVVRSQRFEAFLKKDFTPREGMNHFEGKVGDRSYMGGEVSYFVELKVGPEIHVISMMRSRIYVTTSATRLPCRCRRFP